MDERRGPRRPRRPARRDPEALREYRSAQVEAIEAVIELLDGADGDAVFVPSAGAFALAYGDGFARVSAALSEEAAAALDAAGCDLGR